MDKLIENLRAIVGKDGILSDAAELLVYECDGLPQHKYLPRAVVFPTSTEQTAEVMRLLKRADVPFTPRGAGTGLSGGALALERGVVIEMARMRKILSIDADNRTALVQTGVVNAQVSRAVADLGLHYVPDPSSQGTCTIGGNIAESAGGIHCLKYGTTTDHVLGVKAVLAGGEVVELGGNTLRSGYDLLGVFVGSEGTFGIATEALLRLVPVPPAVRTLLAEFAEVDDASHAVSAIIAAGVMPAALEMMDREIIRAVEASVFAAGLSLDIGAALLIELDGLEAGIDAEAERVRSICLSYGARNCRLARDESERKKLWAARKGAFGAVGRIAPDSMIQDAVVPRSRLPEVMADAYRISAKFNLRLANVFHAGDGNLHPFICFDSRSEEEVQRVKEAGRELMETCVRAGGTITGEHGVGLDKRDFLPLIFSDDDMATMLGVRRAFDPDGLCNPGKIIPMLKGCGEARAVMRRGDAETRGRGDETRGRGDAETRGRGDGETRGRGDAGTRRRGDAETRGRGDAETRGRGDAETRERGDAGTRRRGDAETWGRLEAESKIKRRNDASPFKEEAAASQVGQIVGSSNVSALPDSFSASPRLRVSPSPIPRVAESHPSLLVAPASIEETCEVIKLAASEGWTVVPVGAGSWVDVGNPLKTIRLILSTRRLNRLIDHEPADLVASAEAGLPLQSFNTVLNQGGQWLPLDAPADERTTLGGVVATGLNGAQAVGYGSPRTFVIGMKVVLADGISRKAGGRVVKNVAGYDLCKLFTGSYGTLGVICELTFKLRPRPAKETTVVSAGSLQSIYGAAWSVYQAGLFPVAIELMSSKLAPDPRVPASAGEVKLLIRFAGIADTVDYQVTKAVELIRQSGLNSLVIIQDDQNIWSSLQRIPLSPQQQLTYRLSVRPSDLLRMLETVESNGNEHLSWHAGVADGRLRVMLSQNGASQIQTIATLRAMAEAQGGSLVIENAPSEIKDQLETWGSLSAPALMNRIKLQLDAAELFSPGRF